MKTKIISIVVMLLMACNVMAQDYMRVYFKDGNERKFYLKDITSITTKKLDADGIQHSDYEYQHITTHHNKYVYNLNEVDSITFSKFNEEEVSNNINLAMPSVFSLLDKCKDIKDTESIIDALNNTEGIENSWCDGHQLYVKIFGLEPMTFHFHHDSIDIVTEMSNLSRQSKSIASAISQNGYNSSGKIKAVIANQRYSAFYNLFTDFDILEDNFRECGIDINYNKKNLEPTLGFFMSDMFSYDLIFLVTHGGFDGRQHWLLTSTELGDSFWEPSEVKDDWFKEFNEIINSDEYITKELVYGQDVDIDWTQKTPGGDWYAYIKISENLIKEKSQGRFPSNNSILFNGACLSLYGGYNLANILLGKGLGVYFGYDESTSGSSFAGCNFFNSLLYGKSVVQSYDEIPKEYRDEKDLWYALCDAKLLHSTNKSMDECQHLFLFHTITSELDQEAVASQYKNSKAISFQGFTTSLDPQKIKCGFLYSTDKNLSSAKNVIDNAPVKGSQPFADGRGNVVFRYDIKDLQSGNTYYYCAYTFDGEYYNCGDTLSFFIPVDLQLSTQELTLAPGSTTTVEITSGNGGYSVSVDKPSFATATLSGTTITIKGESKGTAKVTVKDKSGQTAEISVNVWDNLTLSQSSVGLYPGNSTTVEISNGSGHYSVSVDKPAVAAASLSGSVITIKGIGVGSAVVTVTDTSTNQTAKINVTVSSAPTLVVSNSSVGLIVGGSITVDITSGSGSYEITNSNAKVVQAVLDGTKITLTAKTEGNAVVTVKDKATGQTAEIKVSVYSSHSMAETFYKMPTFTTIQDANTTPVTAPGTGTNPITVQNTRTNNTPRYLYTTWGEDGWANANDELPETGYCFSCYFTIVADAGVSNCLEFALLPIDVTVPANHLKLLNTADYFFRFHQAVNSVDGKDSIWVNGDVVNNANWNQGERNGEATVLKVGTKYHIRVDVVGAEAKSTIASEKGEVVYSGTKDISALPNTKMGTLWFNTSGACTYQFDDVKLSYLPHAPFPIKPAVELIACIDTKRDFYVQYEKGTALHWILPGEETEAEGSPVFFTDGKMGRDFEADPNLSGGAWIIECFESGTLKCWTSLEEDESRVSDVVETDVVCETVYLPIPSAFLTNVAAGYGKTYILTVDNAEIPFRPTVTIHYVLKDASGATLSEGDKMSGESVEFKKEGSLDLYAFDNSHPTEWYGKSETVTINNDVEYVLATSKNYQWTKEVCDGTVECFTRLEIVDSSNKSHWDRIYSTQYYGYDADGNIICSNGSWSTGKAEKDVVFWKRGFGFFDKSVIGTENCKWNVQVPNDIYTGFLPLVPESSVGWTANAWSIFPLEGIVYYATTAYLTSGLCPIHLQEKYTSNDPYKPNFYVIHKRGDYDCPDKGDCNSTEVVVAGNTFYLHRYDTAINSVEVYTYKGFVAGF